MMLGVSSFFLGSLKSPSPPASQPLVEPRHRHLAIAHRRAALRADIIRQGQRPQSTGVWCVAPPLRAKGPQTSQPNSSEERAQGWVWQYGIGKAPTGRNNPAPLCRNPSPASSCMLSSARRTASHFSKTRNSAPVCTPTWRASCKPSGASPSSSMAWKITSTSSATYPARSPSPAWSKRQRAVHRNG